MRSLVYLPVLVVLLVVGAPSLQAQDFQVLGIDPLTFSSYQCLRQGDPKFSQIYVTNKKGKSKNVSVKAAKRGLKRSQKLAAKRLKIAKKLQNQLVKKISKLAAKLLLTDKQQKALDSLKARRANIEERVTELTGNVGALKELADALPDCFKPLKVSGNVEIFSGTYVRNDGDVYFYALLHVRWDNYQVNSGNICAQVAGHSVPIPNASGSYRLEAPAVSSFNPTYDLCLYKVDNNINNGCYVRYDGIMSPMAGFGGKQAPGTCGQIEERCSLSAALAILNQRLSQITLSDVKLCE